MRVRERLTVRRDADVVLVEGVGRVRVRGAVAGVVASLPPTAEGRFDLLLQPRYAATLYIQN